MKLLQSALFSRTVCNDALTGSVAAEEVGPGLTVLFSASSSRCSIPSKQVDLSLTALHTLGTR